MNTTLSIIIPVYNEEKTIIKILEKIELVVLEQGIEKEIIVVNDCSSDASDILIQNYFKQKAHLNLKYFSNEKKFRKRSFTS